MIVSAYRNLKNDQIVNEGPTLITGIALHCSADGGSVEVYDGLDVLSGVDIMTVNGWTNDTNPMMFPHPVLLNNGLFVDIGANVTDVTIFFVPLRSGSPMQPHASYYIPDSPEKSE